MAYVCYNGEKYFPLLDCDSADLLDLSANKISFFSVDELMALPVVCLNNKGYLTDMSCSGHGMGTLCYEATEVTEIEKRCEKDTVITVQYSSEDNAEYIYWSGEPTPGAYIKFKNKFEFSTVPDGWEFVTNRKTLSCTVSTSSNPMTYYKNISAALETLMEWILELPSIKP